MYYGELTEELYELGEQYEEIFRHNPHGDMELEFGESDYEEYVELLRQCIAEKRDMFDVLGYEDEEE